MEPWQLMVCILISVLGTHGLKTNVTSTKQLLSGEKIVTLRYTQDHLLAYTANKKNSMVVSSDGEIRVATVNNIDSQHVVSGYDQTLKAEVIVEYSRRCLTYKAKNQPDKRLGQCLGYPEKDPASEVVGPYSAILSEDGFTVIFTDEIADKVRSWDIQSAVLTTLANVKSPRGIVYDESTQGVYVTVSHGVYSVSEQAIITGSDKEVHGSFMDGKLSEAKFSYPYSIALIRPGLLAVADTGNNKIRLVDIPKDEVTTLDTDAAAPSTLAYHRESTTLFVGGAHGITQARVPGFEPVNLCYNLKRSGVADITVEGQTMKVWCDLKSGGGPWITFLRRFDGSTDFDREFSDYQSGFGDPNSEYWLGLENLFYLTKKHNAKLRIDLRAEKAPRVRGSGRTWTEKNITAYALYDNFWIGGGDTDYTLQQIDGYSGTAGDMETTEKRLNMGGPHKGQKFTTKGRDYDESMNDNCAEAFNGGWWFRKCYTVCLTCGPWRSPPTRGYSDAMIYFPYTQQKIGLQESSMKVNLPKEMIYEL